MVAVIGASISGLYVAWRLSPFREVKVFEAGGGPEVSRRLIVTSSFLRYWKAPLPPVLNQVKAYRFVTYQGEAFLPLREPDLVIERRDLIRTLLSSLRLKGISLFEGWAFKGFEGQALVFQTPKGEETIQADWIIGADGASSTVRSVLGAFLPSVYLVQAKVSLNKGHWDSGTSVIWLYPDLTPYFIWLFPDSPKTAVLGLIANSPFDAHRALKDMLLKEGFDPIGYEDGWVSLFEPRFQPERGRVLLVGDAAGQVKVTTVGGTVSGLRAALACERALLKGRSYKRELLPLWFELLSHYWLRRWLDLTGPSFIGGILPWIRRGILEPINRDQLLYSLPLLGLKRPRLVLTVFLHALRYLTSARVWSIHI